ncbi:Endopolyphosphatase [Coemansia sp. RSA 486]|nr:Endopolyphosphatase [Coemansia sp. RSA 486]
MSPNSQPPAGETTVLLSQNQNHTQNHNQNHNHSHSRRSRGKGSSSSLGMWLVYAVAALAGIAVLAMAGMTLWGDHDWDPLPDADGTRLNSSSVGRFVHITDLHIDPNYVRGSTTYSQCHRLPPHSTRVSDKDGHRDTGRFGISQAKCDSPVALINATSEYLRQEWASAADFVIWTGDSGRHDNDAEIPRTFDEIIEQNRLAASAMRNAFGSHGVPVVPNIGNNDISPHNELAAPGHKRARKTFRLLADVWDGLVPKDQLATFLYGGYFARDVVDYNYKSSSSGRKRRGLTVLSLNTIYWYRANAKVGGCAAEDSPGLAQLAWIRYQMRRARQRNRDLILMGHVVPSRDNYRPTCYHGYARTVTQMVPPPPTRSAAESTADSMGKRADPDDLPRVHAQLYGHSNVDVWAFVGHEVEWLASTDPLGAARNLSTSTGSPAAPDSDGRLWWEKEVDEETGRFGSMIREIWAASTPSEELASLADSERDWALMPDDPPVEYVQTSAGLFPVPISVSSEASSSSSFLEQKALPGNFVESLLKEFERVLVKAPKQPRLGVTTISPSIIPKYVPAFRVFYYARAPSRRQWKHLPLGSLLDYDVYWANLPELNKLGKRVETSEFFQLLYRFSTVYRVGDLSVESYLHWARKLLEKKSLRKRFRALTYLNTQ